MKSSEIESQIWSVDFNKGIDTVQWIKNSYFSTNGAGIIGYLYAKNK